MGKATNVSNDLIARQLSSSERAERAAADALEGDVAIDDRGRIIQRASTTRPEQEILKVDELPWD